MGNFSMLGKGTMLESSVRVPLFIKPPGHRHGRIRRQEIVNTIDLFRTILDYACIRTPAAAQNSRSLRPLVEQKRALWKNETFSSFCSPDLKDGLAMYVRDDVKVVSSLKDGQHHTHAFYRRGKAGLEDVPLPGPVPAEMEQRLSEWLTDTAAGRRSPRHENENRTAAPQRRLSHRFATRRKDRIR